MPTFNSGHPAHDIVPGRPVVKSCHAQSPAGAADIRYGCAGSPTRQAAVSCVLCPHYVVALASAWGQMSADSPRRAAAGKEKTHKMKKRLKRSIGNPNTMPSSALPIKHNTLIPSASETRPVFVQIADQKTELQRRRSRKRAEAVAAANDSKALSLTSTTISAPAPTAVPALSPFAATPSPRPSHATAATPPAAASSPPPPPPPPPAKAPGAPPRKNISTCPFNYWKVTLFVHQQLHHPRPRDSLHPRRRRRRRLHPLPRKLGAGPKKSQHRRLPLQATAKLTSWLQSG